MRWTFDLISAAVISLICIDAVDSAQGQSSVQVVWHAGLFFQNLSPGELDEYKVYIRARAEDQSTSASERSVRRCELHFLNLPVFDAMLEIEKEFRADPENLQIKKLFARACSNAEFDWRARELLEEVLEVTQDDIEALILNYALMIETEDQYAENLKGIESLAETEPYAWVLLAKLAHEFDNPHDTLKFTSSFFQIRPTGTAREANVLHILRAHSLFTLDLRLEEACTDLERALELEPNDPNSDTARKLLSHAYAGCGRISEAVDEAKRATNPVETLASVGHYLASRDCFPQAVETLQAAVELDSTNKTIARYLSYVLAVIERPDESRRAYAQWRADEAYAGFVQKNGEIEKAVFLAKCISTANEDPQFQRIDDSDDVDLYEMAAVAARQILEESPNLEFQQRAACVYCIANDTGPDSDLNEAYQAVRELRSCADTSNEVAIVDSLDNFVQWKLRCALQKNKTREPSIHQSGNLIQPFMPELK